MLTLLLKLSPVRVGSRGHILCACPAPSLLQVRQPHVHAQPYFGGSELSPGGAGAPAPVHTQQHHTHSMGQMDTVKFFSLCTFFGLGAHSTVPHYLWTRQSCVRVPQCFASCTFFLGERVPHEHAVAPHCLHTRYRSIVLAPPSLQVEDPLVCTAQQESEAAPCCSCWINLWVEVSLLCTLWHSLAPVSVAGDLL